MRAVSLLPAGRPLALPAAIRRSCAAAPVAQRKRRGVAFPETIVPATQPASIDVIVQGRLRKRERETAAVPCATLQMFPFCARLHLGFIRTCLPPIPRSRLVFCSFPTSLFLILSPSLSFSFLSFSFVSVLAQAAMPCSPCRPFIFFCAVSARPLRCDVVYRGGPAAAAVYLFPWERLGLAHTCRFSRALRQRFRAGSTLWAFFATPDRPAPQKSRGLLSSRTACSRAELVARGGALQAVTSRACLHADWRKRNASVKEYKAELRTHLNVR